MLTAEVGAASSRYMTSATPSVWKGSVLNAFIPKAFRCFGERVLELKKREHDSVGVLNAYASGRRG